MSYDINFWKQSCRIELSPEQIYQKLCEGEVVEGLEPLPLANIYSGLQAEFSNFDPTNSFPHIECEECGIEVSSSPQHVRFDLRGEEIGTAASKLVGIMSEFECPLYDPQINKRFDRNQGTRLGYLPQFADPSSDRRARSRKLRKEAAERILEKIKVEKSTKSASELTKDEASFIELELKFWQGDLNTYRTCLAQNAFVVYPQPLGVKGYQELISMAKVIATMNAMTNAPAWTEVAITEVRIVYPICDIALVMYRADARRTKNDPPYKAMVSSMYICHDGHWRLTFHQQSPDLEKPTTNS